MISTPASKLTTSMLLVSVIMASAACGRPDDGAGNGGAGNGGGPGTDNPWPQDRTFWSTSVTEAGQDRPLVADTRPSVRFGKPGQLTTEAGCNSFGIGVRIEGDRMIATGYTATAIGCTEDRLAQDRWMQHFFADGPTWQLTGDDLVLRAGATEVRLTDSEVLDPDRPLVATRWVVVTMTTSKGGSSVPPDAAHLQFAADATVTGATGCATLTGTAEVRGDTIVFGTVERAEHPCEGLLVELDAAVMGTLQGAVPFHINGPSLTLGMDGIHDNGLVLRAPA